MSRFRYDVYIYISLSRPFNHPSTHPHAPFQYIQAHPHIHTPGESTPRASRSRRPAAGCRPRRPPPPGPVPPGPIIKYCFCWLVCACLWGLSEPCDSPTRMTRLRTDQYDCQHKGTAARHHTITTWDQPISIAIQGDSTRHKQTLKE